MFKLIKKIKQKHKERNKFKDTIGAKPTEEFIEFVRMPYLDLVQALNEKYGAVEEPFFKQKDGRLYANNRIKRGSEGLEVHHVAENQFLLLSDSKNALKHDFKYQEPEYLVYANELEHALLHAKIITEYNGVKEDGKQVGYGGLYTFQIPLINDFYSGWTPTNKAEIAKLKAISTPQQKQNFLLLIKYLIDNHKDSPKLYTSFNQKAGIWENNQNRKLYDTFVALGAKPYNRFILKENDSRMNKNFMVGKEGRVDKVEHKPAWWIWLVLPYPIILMIVVILIMILG